MGGPPHAGGRAPGASESRAFRGNRTHLPRLVVVDAGDSEGMVRSRLLAGWAYSEDYDPEGSLLPGRKFVLLCPAGSSEDHFSKYGYDEMFLRLFEVGTLSYCGVTESEVHVLFEVYWDKELTESYIPRAHEIGRSAFGSRVTPDTADPRVPGSPC